VDEARAWPTRASRPTPAEIRWARGASLDLLRIRASSTLFRLRTADDVRRRLHFRNVGPAQDPAVLVGLLDGSGYPGAGFGEVLYLVNVSGAERAVTVPEAAGKAYVLHPVHRAADAADRTARAARVDAASGQVHGPGAHGGGVRGRGAVTRGRVQPVRAAVRRNPGGRPSRLPR
jgi:hypothetical protein